MEKLNRQVRRAQWWLGVGRFIRSLGWCCFATLFLAVGLVAVDKFRPLGVEAWMWGAGALGLGGILAVVWATMSGRGRVDAAIEIDHRFGLKERVASALALSEEQRQTDIGMALAEDAARRVERIDVSERFQASPGRQIFLPLIPIAIGALVILLPAPGADNQKTAEASTVNKQVVKTTTSLRDKLVEKRKQAESKGLADAQKLFEQLQKDTDEMTAFSKGDRKPALIKLNDLARQIEERRNRLGGAENIQKQLNQLKNVSKGPADKLLDELKRGNFAKAKEQLEQLKKDLASGKLSDKQKEELAAQLDGMQEKLQDMVDAHRQAEEELQKQVDQARREGRDDKANQLQNQLNKLRQQIPQMDQLANMADTLGKCSQCVQDGELANAEAALDDLQADLDNLKDELQELDMLDEAMDQLAECRNQMNCKQCGGAGCGACQGMGMGMGEGQGAGPRPENETDVKFRDTRTAQKVGKGGMSVVGEVDGPNIKGDVRQEIQEQYESSQIEAADPLTGRRMPRKHRQHAQEYFDRFRKGE